MLETYIIVTAHQPKEGKKSPIHALEASHMETFKSKEDVIQTISNLSTIKLYKDVFIKSIYSVNEFGHVTFYDVVFNGKLILKTVMNPCSPKTSETYTEDDLPFYDIDDVLDGDTDEEEIKTEKRPKRKPKGTCSGCNRLIEDCTCDDFE